MRYRLAMLAAIAVLPAIADTQFRVRQMTRDDVPRGKGQCDIRLQVDNEVEVAVRGESVFLHTLAGEDARDDGSECNAPLPRRDVPGFKFEVKEKRNEIRMVEAPSRRNDYAAIVRIRDSAAGFGRYHFRISWDLDAGRTPEGFSRNNVTNFRGQGRGSILINNSGERRLTDVNVDIDRSDKVLVTFKAERGPSVIFTGAVVDRGESRIKAEVATEDHQLRGPMYLLIDGPRVNNIKLEATDGRDRLRLNWDRR